MQKPSAPAQAKGTGLTGTYFAGDTFAGQPILARTDPQIWFGTRWFPAIASPRKPRPWIAQGEKTLDLKSFSARWTGTLEPRFTESYHFFVECAPQNQMRLWVNGQLIINGASGQADAPATVPMTIRGGWQFASEPVPLVAGTPIAIRLEYATGGGEPALHLSWESYSQERQHVPAASLYEAKPD